MKSAIRNIVLLFALPVVALVSCKKSDSSSPGPGNAQTTTSAATVDTIIGTYNGYMHVHDWVCHYSDSGSITDTTYPFSITIQKVAADSFTVGDVQFLYWTSPFDGTSTSHIHFDSSNYYITFHPRGENDTLRFVPAVDSIYFHSTYSHLGGSSSEIEIRTFAGKK